MSIFVVQDADGTLRRVQVKTAQAKIKKTGFSGQFNISVRNLRNITNILVHYVFIVRYQDTWTKPILIRQDYLLGFFENNHVGSQHNEAITFYFSFSQEKITCSGFDFTAYTCDYSDFPLIEH